MSIHVFFKIRRTPSWRCSTKRHRSASADPNAQSTLINLKFWISHDSIKFSPKLCFSHWFYRFALTMIFFHKYFKKLKTRINSMNKVDPPFYDLPSTMGTASRSTIKFQNQNDEKYWQKIWNCVENRPNSYKFSWFLVFSTNIFVSNFRVFAKYDFQKTMQLKFQNQN